MFKIDAQARRVRKMVFTSVCCTLSLTPDMTTPYTPSPTPFIPSAIPQVPAPPTRGRGAKRGRKPRGAVLSSGPASHQASAGTVTPGGSVGVGAGGPQFTPVQWANPTVPAVGPSTPLPVSVAPSVPASQPIADASASGPGGASDAAMDSGDEAGPSTSTTIPPAVAASTTAANNATAAGGSAGTLKLGAGAGDDDGEGDDELLPAMADDDYSAQLSWQSESKDNLKCVFYPQSREDHL